MTTDLVTFLLAGACVLALFSYSAYLKYCVDRAVMRARYEAMAQARQDAVAYVRLCGTVAPTDTQHIYARLARKLEEMPLE